MTAIHLAQKKKGIPIKGSLFINVNFERLN